MRYSCVFSFHSISTVRRRYRRLVVFIYYYRASNTLISPYIRPLTRVFISSFKSLP
ncbi:hypothetical protein PPV_Vac110-(243-244)n2 [Avipoxvirus sp.]|uniref:Uncharacterized protein n=1 Tax=Fowlpox virus TaxID=10261 RepID=A0A891LWP8_FOWPV|nr:hypothetical protein [Fowlpox virus]UNS14496.1 ALPV-332 [Albatrosspox virus]UQT20794.1 hypothetical protein [Fowlpox virus]WPD90990.1 hypothetical protein PPV_Vac110-(243-244)n2 [Avipoxvirus sp.]